MVVVDRIVFYFILSYIDERTQSRKSERFALSSFCIGFLSLSIPLILCSISLRQRDKAVALWEKVSKEEEEGDIERIPIVGNAIVAIVTVVFANANAICHFKLPSMQLILICGFEFPACHRTQGTQKYLAWIFCWIIYQINNFSCAFVQTLSFYHFVSLSL